MQQQKVTKIHIYRHIDRCLYLSKEIMKQGDSVQWRMYPTFIDAVTADTTVGEIPK